MNFNDFYKPLFIKLATSRLLSSVAFLTLYAYGTHNLLSQNKNDSLSGFPFLGQKIVLPLYNSCGGLKEDIVGIVKVFDKILIPFMENSDTFGYTLSVHSDCRSSAAYNIDYTTYIADSLCGILKRKLRTGTDLICTGAGESDIVNNCHCESGYLQDLRKQIPDSVLAKGILEMRDSSNNSIRRLNFEDIKNMNPYVKFVYLCTESSHQENRRFVLLIRKKENNSKK